MLTVAAWGRTWKGLSKVLLRSWNMMGHVPSGLRFRPSTETWLMYTSCMYFSGSLTSKTTTCFFFLSLDCPGISMKLLSTHMLWSHIYWIQLQIPSISGSPTSSSLSVFDWLTKGWKNMYIELLIQSNSQTSRPLQHRIHFLPISCRLNELLCFQVSTSKRTPGLTNTTENSQTNERQKIYYFHVSV